MSYVQLTTSERVKIENYLELGFSMRKIAQHLERQPSTISRELKRNPSYNAVNAGRRYEMQKKNCEARRFAWLLHPYETARDMGSRLVNVNVLQTSGIERPLDTILSYQNGYRTPLVFRCT